MGNFTLALKNIRGETVTFADPYLVGTITGLGLPPVLHATEQYAQQDGETLHTIRLRKRVISVPFEILEDSNLALWSTKTTLYAFLSTVKSPYTWIATLPDGSVRCLDCYFSGELSMPLDPMLGPVVHKDVGQWTAYDPTWYDPTSLTWAFAVSGGAGSWGHEPDGLGFDAGWGAAAADGTPETKTYPGTWRSYPKIILMGPMTAPQIDNYTTGETLEFDAGYVLDPAETITIDLAQGYKTVTHSVDGPIPDQLTDDSDLATFHIAEHPYAVHGNNSIGVAFTGGTIDSRVYIQVIVRYLALQS
jgi:hypothetical protein